MLHAAQRGCFVTQQYEKKTQHFWREYARLPGQLFHTLADM